MGKTETTCEAQPMSDTATVDDVSTRRIETADGRFVMRETTVNGIVAVRFTRIREAHKDNSDG